MNFTSIDYFILVILLLSLWIGLRRGFIREIFSLIIWIVAFLVSLKFAPMIMHSFAIISSTPKTQYWLAAVVLFFIVLLVGGILSHLITGPAMLSGIEGLNRVLGLVFGFLRGVLLVIIFLMIVNTTSAAATWDDGSVFIPYFQPLVHYFEGMVPSQFETAVTWIKQTIPV